MIRTKVWLGLLILAPIVTHLALSAIKLYPFGDRLILYLVPLFLMLLSAGLYSLIKINRYIALCGFALMIHLSFKPATAAVQLFSEPLYREHITGVFDYIESRIAPNDKIYIYAASAPAYSIYEDNYFEGNEVIIGEKSPKIRLNELI